MNELMALVLEDGYWTVSLNLVKEFGFEKAGILTDLIGKYMYFKQQRSLLEKEWFFYRRENMTENWKLKIDVQRRILGELKEEGLIDFEKKGPFPQKNYYTINENNITKLILSLQAKYKAK